MGYTLLYWFINIVMIPFLPIILPLRLHSRRSMGRLRTGIAALWAQGDTESIHRILSSIVSQKRSRRFFIRLPPYGALMPPFHHLEVLAIAVRNYARLERHDLALEAAELGVGFSLGHVNFVTYKVDALVALDRRDEAVALLRANLGIDEGGLLSSRLDSLFPGEGNLH